MNVEFTGRNVQITDALRSFTFERLKKVTHQLDHLISIYVSLKVEGYRHAAEVVVTAKSRTFKAAAETEDMYLAIGKAIEKLDRQVKSFRGKQRTTSRKKRGSGEEAGSELLREEAGKESPQIIESDSYRVKPMAVEDAAIQLSQAGDSFLVFRNAQSNQVNVVYRRSDGNIGLIQP